MLKKLCQSFLVVFLFIFFTFKIPEWHYNYIRSYVGSKVVKITNEALNSGGTGVHITTPHGYTYILTNAHVCGVAKDNIVWVTNDYGTSMPRRVIELSKYTDLCLIEPLPGTSGLSIGSEAVVGDIVAVVGHPRLMPTTVNRGEIIGQAKVEVLDHEINPQDENDKCNLPKQKHLHYTMGFWDTDLCILEIEAYLTNIVILPGNSGSPVVNKWGNLVALAFASDNEAHWGLFVTLKDIQTFIKSY